jgi:ketosteroid isomerase-like protein
MMRRVVWHSLSSVALVVAGACFLRHTEEPPAPLRSPVRDSLIAADAARGDAVNQRGLAGAAGAWLDTTVIYLRAGAPIVYGRANALAVISDSASERARYQWRPLGGGVSRDGRSGYTYGTAMIATPNEGVPALRSDHYVAYWRRGSDGVWRILAYADVGGPPLPGGASVPSVELPPLPPIRNASRAEAVRRVRSADSAFALAADLQGTGIAFANYIAPQGVIFSGSEIVIGSDAVRALYDEQQHAGGTLNWRPIYANAAETGDLGFTVGEYVFTGRGMNGAVVQRFGKYITIWKKQPGGEWKFVVDGGNASPTPNR